MYCLFPGTFATLMKTSVERYGTDGTVCALVAVEGLQRFLRGGLHLSRLGVSFRPFEQARVSDLSRQVTRMLLPDRAIENGQAPLHIGQSAGRLSHFRHNVADEDVAPPSGCMFFPVPPLPQTQRVLVAG